MLRFHNYFKQSPQNKLLLKNNTQLAYAGQWKKVYSNTEIDKWYVGDYSSANYTITAEFSSNKKEVLQVLVVARPDQATVTVYGRTSIDDSLINISAVVTNSYLSLIANVTDTAFVGTKVIFFANYAECIQPLSLAESLSFVDGSSGGGYDGGGAGGSATSFSQLSGTIGISQIPNGLITPAKLNLNSSLIPSADVIHDLGSATYRWRDLYLSGSSIQLGDATITASGNSVNLPPGSSIAGAAINSFSTIQVSGQSNIIADSVSDSLTIVAGPGIEITTDAGSDSITITNSGGGGGGASGVSSGTAGNLAYYASTGSVVQDTGEGLTWNGSTLSIAGTISASGAVSYVRAYFDTLVELQAVSSATWHGMVAHVHETGRIYFAHAGAWLPVANLSDLNYFSTIAVAGQSSVVAESATDTLTLVAGPNITITTNATNDSITISAAAAGGGGAGGVSSGQENRLAYYASTGTIVQDTGANLTWNGTNLNIIGSVTATAPVSYIRAYFDTLAELQLVSPVTWHGMIAHVHENGRMYFAHAGAWVPLANQSDLINNFSTVAVAGQSSVVADQLSDTLTLAAGTGIAITTNAGTDTVTISATGSGGGVASNSFETIVVAGQANVVADSSTDTLTLVAGSNITITTNAGTDTITISAAGGGGAASDSFSTIAVAGQSSVVADSATDILTLVAGTGISITTNAGTDTVTITSTVSAGATAFTGLSDSAGLTVDKFYLQAITRLNVTNFDVSAYRFDQYGTTNNPTIYAISGTTIAFDLNVAGHPFLIQTSGDLNYNEGLTHVTTAGVVTTGSSAQGKTSGTLYWKVPTSISGNYRYRCSIHGGMVGVITVKDISAI